MNRVPMRYAHSAGHTDVCYSEDGSKIITCGADGDVRIFHGFSDDDPMQSCVGSWSLTVRQKGDHIYIATDNNTVQILTYPDGERDGLLTRFTAHVNHISTGKNHKYIAMAGEDMEVKVMQLPYNSEENQTPKAFQGFSGPPLAVEICPKGEMLAVSSGDGLLRIWNLSSEELLKQFDCVPKANSFMNAKLFCRMSFEPVSGINLAYPDGSSVIVVNTTNWKKQFSLSCAAVQNPYSIVEYSPCGQYLAAASSNGDIVVWEVNTETLIGCTVHPGKVSVCAMRWSPEGNGEIAYCDVDGKLGIVENCNFVVEKKKPQASGESVEKELPDNMDFDEIRFADNDDDDDDDGENVISLEKLKKDIMGPGDDDMDDKLTSRCSSPRVRSRTPEIPLQAPFQPSSTPEHLNPRYLCWNEIGIVRCYGSTFDEDSPRSIEVEFLDSTFHNSMMMQNYQGYTMASLSSAALIVANSRQATVVPLASGSKEWTISLPDEEDLTCITASGNLVCLGTSTYQLRLFTIYGTQCLITSVSGPFVALAANGYNVVAAYHASGIRKGDQCIGLMHVYCKGKSINSKNLDCPLSPEGSLHWLGFSDQGSLVSYDSVGILRLHPFQSNIWFPCMDIGNHKTSISDGFFVTAVMESRQVVRGIRCKGTIYPGFTPQPTQTELSLEPPFVEMDTEKAQLEASLCTWSVLDVDGVDKKYKESALKLFALACKNNLDQRALELIEVLSSTQLLSLAAKYATKLDRMRLAEKLFELSETLEENVEEERPYRREVSREEKENVVSTPTIKPLAKKLVLSSSKYSSSKNKSKLTPSTSKSSSNEAATETREESQTNSTPGLNTLDVNTQASLFSGEDSAPKNPFLKGSKNKNSNYNPLSLTDKFAGYNAEIPKAKSAPAASNNSAEKRKCPDNSEPDKQKDKQRKLDGFMFKKRT